MTPARPARRGCPHRRSRICAAVALFGLPVAALAQAGAVRAAPPPQAVESAPLPATPKPRAAAAPARPAASATASATAPRKPAPAAPAASAGAAGAAASAPRRDSAAALNALDTRLVADRTAGAVAPRNAFEARTWTLPPPPPPPAASGPPPAPPPPPPPVAPPMPFKYMGMLQESPSRTLWYLLAGDRLLVGATGDVIDNNYRIEGVEAGKLQLTYLPLKQRQSLAIGVSP